MGLGQTIPASTDGVINRVPPAVPRTMPAVVNWANGEAFTQVTFIGAAPFQVAGVSQLNILAPATAPSAGFMAVFVGRALANVYVSQ